MSEYMSGWSNQKPPPREPFPININESEKSQTENMVIAENAIFLIQIFGNDFVKMSQ